MKLIIESSDPAEIAKLLSAVSGNAPTPAKAAPAAQPIAATPPANPTPAATPAASPSPTLPPASAPAATLNEDAVRNAMNTYVKSGNGRSASTARAILQSHGLTAIKGMPPEKYQAVFDAFQV